MEIFIDIILPAALWPRVEPASNRNEYQDYLLGGKGGRCLGIDNLPTFMYRLSRNSGSLNLLEPKGVALHAYDYGYFFF